MKLERKMKKFKFANSQKMKVIVDGISFYTTVNQIRAGVGQNSKLNMQVNNLLICLEAKCKVDNVILGIGGRLTDSWNIQLDVYA